jgi:hypothetical protein
VPSWGDLLGSGSVAEQLLVWGVLNQLLNELLGPALDLLRQEVNAAHPEAVLTPPDLADAVVRGVADATAAAAEAAKSGVSAERFDIMQHLAGEPIGLQQGLEALRRGFMPAGDIGIDQPSLARLVFQSRYYNMWLPIIEALAEVPLTGGESVNAALRGQASYDEMAKEAYASGINAERFRILFDSAGRPPSPMELVTLLRRGLIPLTGVGADQLTFQQGVYEGDSKDKWWPLFAKLAVAVPPPRTVSNLVKTGSLTDTQAAGYFADAGLDSTLVAAYLHSARGEKLAGSRHLAQSNVITMYETGAMARTDALAHLTAIGYDDADAALVLELADLQRELRAVNSAVTKTATLYVAHKITRQGASEALTALELTPAHRDQLLATWDAERAANVRPLTEAQITGAWEYEILTEAEALAELEGIGMTPFDAWVALSVKAKAPLPGRPGRGPGGPGVT